MQICWGTLQWLKSSPGREFIYLVKNEFLMPNGAGGVAIEMLARQQSDNGTERHTNQRGRYESRQTGCWHERKQLSSSDLLSQTLLFIFLPMVSIAVSLHLTKI